MKSLYIVFTLLIGFTASAITTKNIYRVTYPSHLLYCEWHFGRGGFDRSQGTIQIDTMYLQSASSEKLISNIGRLSAKVFNVAEMAICQQTPDLTVTQVIEETLKIDGEQCIQTLTERLTGSLASSTITTTLYGGSTEFKRIVDVPMEHCL